MTTLNQVTDKIKQISLAHKQVRSYEQQGLTGELNNEKDINYPAVNLIVQPGSISFSGKKTTFFFDMTIRDLVNESKDTLTNEWDVVSDMTSIAEDLLAQLNSPFFDWYFSTDNNLQFLFDNENDVTGGVVIKFSISVVYVADRCQVPSEEITNTINDEDVKVYDVEYIANGTEGAAINTTAAGSSLNVVTGKKIILVTRESAPLHKVSNNPDPAEYTWNDTSIGVGTTTNAGERFLILYRNY